MNEMKNDNQTMDRAIPVSEQRRRKLRRAAVAVVIAVAVLVITSIKDDVLRIRNGSFYSGPGDYTLFVIDHSPLNIDHLATPEKADADNVQWSMFNGQYLRPRPVRLGDCNYDYIEVVSGLEQGEQVVVSDMTKYKGKEKLKVK